RPGLPEGGECTTSGGPAPERSSGSPATSGRCSGSLAICRRSTHGGTSDWKQTSSSTRTWRCARRLNSERRKSREEKQTGKGTKAAALRAAHQKRAATDAATQQGDDHRNHRSHDEYLFRSAGGLSG